MACVQAFLRMARTRNTQHNDGQHHEHIAVANAGQAIQAIFFAQGGKEKLLISKDQAMEDLRNGETTHFVKTLVGAHLQTDQVQDNLVADCIENISSDTAQQVHSTADKETLPRLIFAADALFDGENHQIGHEDAQCGLINGAMDRPNNTAHSTSRHQNWRMGRIRCTKEAATRAIRLAI